MDTVGLGFYFEDLPVGRVFRTISRTITEADLVNYINCLGLVEVLFTDAKFREEASEIKRRVVPGLLAHGIAEGLLVQATLQHTGLAFLEMGLKMHGPVFVNDTIHVEVEIVEARLSKSRPGRGLVRSTNRVVKEDGTIVMTYTPLRLIKCRHEITK